MIYPNKSQYSEDSQRFNLIPVFREMRADFETPVSIFLKVNAKILLESVEQGENVGRFSFIALGKRVIIKMNGQELTIDEYNGEGVTASENFVLKNPLEKIREYFKDFTVPQYNGLPPFFGGAIGYLGYETLQYFEDVPVNHSSEYDTIPDGLLVVPEVVLVYDSVKRSVFVIALTMPGSNGCGSPETCYQEAVHRIEEICHTLSQPFIFSAAEPEAKLADSPFTVDVDANVNINYRMKKTDFLDAVNTCKDYIRAGDIIQVVFSQQFTMETSASPFELYRTLRVVNPSPYLFFLDFDDFCLIGSSPEVMVRVRDGEILLKPIAGTRERAETVAEDSSISRELLSDPKERAEHLMLVDLGRNDVGRVSAPGSVRVTDFMKVEKYSHVMHMVSTIKGELDKTFDVFDVIRACFPAGTLTGAPKIRAMEIISELETEKRGPYGGMIFNLGFNGNLDSCITIRTIILKDNIAYIQAGAGIVADSVPEKEYEETMNKAGALFDTIELTRTGGAA
ncbi:MAG: anthranilate synthase component I [Candidatus Aminicenantes bacterium]|nr:anthranilate synthase component I [Candidatus Aminicenantes bacterium]NIM77531.1 anthranilate synthase component I [Candidatus Aminicenantes bacterium]NIN16847.1 anthranilate synthase component I [Candidatus Aminicenantes bacterium]NIN40726.1 anthranilate synthase component I [Candidatus Aminicenantes bacterium]NIN83535.1 anthranilate synthase component I [Candidatus Aminicenantes bacterium]